jgi:branched-chain amino acid transport system ATP-binding protein
MTHPKLEILTHLQKSFGAVGPTQGVNLHIAPGELHAIIGPNGAGKTTLLSQICGEILPDAGSILLDGRDVTALPAHERARPGPGALVPDQPSSTPLSAPGQRRLAHRRTAPAASGSWQRRSLSNCAETTSHGVC